MTLQQQRRSSRCRLSRASRHRAWLALEGSVAFVFVPGASVARGAIVSVVCIVVAGVFFVPLQWGPFAAVVLVLFASSLDGALVVGVEAYASPCFFAETFPFLDVVGGGAGGGGFAEEEGEEFVWDGEMGRLLELLEGEETEESFEERE